MAQRTEGFLPQHRRCREAASSWAPGWSAEHVWCRAADYVRQLWSRPHPIAGPPCPIGSSRTPRRRQPTHAHPPPPPSHLSTVVHPLCNQANTSLPPINCHLCHLARARILHRDHPPPPRTPKTPPFYIADHSPQVGSEVPPARLSASCNLQRHAQQADRVSSRPAPSPSPAHPHPRALLFSSRPSSSSSSPTPVLRLGWPQKRSTAVTPIAPPVTDLTHHAHTLETTARRAQKNNIHQPPPSRPSSLPQPAESRSSPSRNSTTRPIPMGNALGTPHPVATRCRRTSSSGAASSAIPRPSPVTRL